METILLKCVCGQEIRCNAPAAPGNYSVTCQKCGEKICFRYPFNADSKEEKTKEETGLGLREDGSFCFRCENHNCRKTVLVPANLVKIGHNTVSCPKCGILHKFEVEPKEEDLLKCQTATCDGILTKPEGDEDTYYPCTCDKCGAQYHIKKKDGKVTKVILATSKQRHPVAFCKMKLVVGRFPTKKEYALSKGVHYVGRFDDTQLSDFQIKDEYASSRSVRIDVNGNGGCLIYKLTVERATNPVFHNSRELTVGDVVYLSYGDTLKLGKTFIRIQKVEP